MEKLKKQLATPDQVKNKSNVTINGKNETSYTGSKDDSMQKIEMPKVPMLTLSHMENNETPYDGYEDDSLEKRAFDRFAMEYIRKGLSEQFYLEGKNKDYYFGKSPLNKGLTVFYNKERVESRIWYIVDGLKQEALKNCFFGKDFENIHGTSCWNLSEAGLNVSSGRRYTCNYRNRVDKDMKLSFIINVLEPNVLEKAIQREPERWALYQKVVNGK